MDDFRDTPSGPGLLGDLGPGISSGGGIDFSGDRDVFSSSSPFIAGLTYTLSVSAEFGDVRPVLELITPDGTILRDEVDDTGFDRAEIVFTAVSSDDHYLIVSSKGRDDTGRYSISSAPGVATAGDDVVRGSGMSDRIAGGEGADIVVGGRGDDVLWGDSGWFIAPDGDDVIYGGSGDDVMYGGDGADTFFGGDGDDYYNDVDREDEVRERPGGGSDFVFAAIDYTLGPNVEGVSLFISSAVRATGNKLDNYIEGNFEDNVLRGRAGADDIYGGEGADALYGGCGADVLNGGWGADALVGGPGSDIFFFNGYSDSDPTGIEGRDVIRGDRCSTAFQLGADRIDLSRFDADGTLAGLQTLILDGTTGKGRLWIAEWGSSTVIRANVDDDAAADFEVAIADDSVRAREYGPEVFIL